MLRTDRPGPTDFVGSYAASPSPGQRELDLAEIVAFLRRQWPVIAATLAAILVLALVYLATATPLYTAKTLFMLDARHVQLFGQQSVISDFTFNNPTIESELEVLKSESVAASVVQDQKLDKDPEFTGQTHSFFGALISSIVNLGSFGLNTGQSDQETTRAALNHFQQNLSITRVGRTYVIEIGFRSANPGKAARIANAVTDAYILHQLQSKYKTTKRASAWLKERLAELRDQAVATDQAVQDFRAKNNLTESDDGRLRIDYQLTDLSTQLIMARAQTAQAKARLDRIEEFEKSAWKDTALPEALHNYSLSRLHEQYTDAAKQATEYASRFGADSPVLIGLRRRMAELEQAISDELRRAIESSHTDYEAAKSREEMLQANLDQLSKQTTNTREAQVNLRVLEASAQAYRKLYDSFLQRFVEATQQQSFPDSEARVITEASVARKTYPKTTLVLGSAGIFGIIFGCGIAYIRERFDRVFRTAHQVEQIVGTECLGILPEIEGKEATEAAEDIAEPSENPASRSIPRDIGIIRHVIKAPFSRFTETIRGIKVAADMNNPRARIIGVVSVVSDEGKSTVSANLAELIAHTGSRALLIDCDLRLSSLSRLIAPATEQGLAGVLDGRIALADAVWHDPLTGLEFLPVAAKGQMAHTNEIVSSPAMEKLLTAAREQYDYIVVDFPPLAPVIDAKAAAHLIDAFVLVIYWGQTSLDALAETLRNADVIRQKLLGAVLNRANLASLKRLEAYKGRSYQSYYSSYVSAD